MPRSAIDAGLADVVAPAEELPGRIVELSEARRSRSPRRIRPRRARRRAPWRRCSSCSGPRPARTSPCTRRAPSTAAIERRMGLHQIDKIATYVRFLRENPQELELLFKELLIGVTSFFRDPAAWEQLQDGGHPGAAAPPVRRAGCCGPGRPAAPRGRRPIPWPWSSGRRWSGSSRPGPFSLQIFATDLDRDAIDKARAGVYPANIAADVSPERLRRFFAQEEHGYRVGKEIREMVVFAPQNVIMDPPFTKLDLLICRNLLIYLDPELQRKLHAALSLQPESRRHPVPGQCGDHRRLHRPVRPAGRQKARLYQRLDDRLGRQSRSNFPPRSSPISRRAESAQPQARIPGAQSADRWRINCSCSASRRQPCCRATRAISSTSAGARANTWSRRRARPTGTYSPWRARGCAMS